MEGNQEINLTPSAEAAVVDAPVVETVTVDAPETPKVMIQSQADYFASAFSYQPPTPETTPTDAATATAAAGPDPATGSDSVITPIESTGGVQGSYGSQSSYGAQGGYDSQSSYGSQSSFGTQNSYNGQSSYGLQSGYDNQSSYGSQSAYGGQNSYFGAGSTYGSQNTYGSQSSYGSQGAYGSQNSYGGAVYQQPQTTYVKDPFSPAKSYPSGGYYPNSGEYSTPDYNPQSLYANDPFASYYDEEEMPPRLGNGLAIAALVLGIVSIVSICTRTGLVPGIIAIILGAKGAEQCENKAMAKTGMILGIGGTLAGIISIVALILQFTTSIMDYLP